MENVGPLDAMNEFSAVRGSCVSLARVSVRLGMFLEWIRRE